MSQPTEQTENPTGWTPHLCGPARPTADMAGAEERSSQLCGPGGEDPGQAPGPGGWAVARKLEGAGLCPTWVGQGAQGTSSWVAFCPLWHGPQGVAGGTPPGLHQKLCQSRPGPPWSSGAAGGTWEGPGHPGGEAWPRGAFREAVPRNRPQIINPQLWLLLSGPEPLTCSSRWAETRGALGCVVTRSWIPQLRGGMAGGAEVREHVSAPSPCRRAAVPQRGSLAQGHPGLCHRARAGHRLATLDCLPGSQGGGGRRGGVGGGRGPPLPDVELSSSQTSPVHPPRGLK